MSKVYICDACGSVTDFPHQFAVSEFNTAGNAPDYGMTSAFSDVSAKERVVHLCDDCFHGLKLVSEGAKMPEKPESPTIRVKYFSDEIDKLEYIEGKSDWIDLRAAEEVEMASGDFKLIPLGIAMQLPSGYEAHIIPRSSTFKNFGIIQTNHMGLIDESYCGDDDQWFFPALAMRDTIIHVGDRICQFRIIEHQPQLTFETVENLGNENRGGIGSTGTK